jgi:hypothetical protein
LRDRTIEEHRLGEVDDVVDDDLRAGVGQRYDAGSEILSAERCREFVHAPTAWSLTSACPQQCSSVI